MKLDRKPIFVAVRDLRGGQGFTTAEVSQLDAGINLTFASLAAAGVQLGPVVQEAIAVKPRLGLSAIDYAWAAQRLGWTVPQIRAVDQVESAGSGWFTDIRGDILALDGPGGFIDGQYLTKILYEAHVFARNCSPKGKFNAKAPNLSSAKWNRSLYVGGQAEYVRLYKATLLDREAAFKAVSLGRYQILGENHRLAGYGTAEAFFVAMQVSERAHLEGFVNFIINAGLVDEGRRISSVHADCRPFALGYNGSQADKNNYPAKIARAYKAALA